MSHEGSRLLQAEDAGLIGDSEGDNVRPRVETRPRRPSRSGAAVDDAMEMSGESEIETGSDDKDDSRFV